MYKLQNPAWLRDFKYSYKSAKEIPFDVFERINGKLYSRKTDKPLVSIVVIAWNEERNILNCISSLAHMETRFAYEIIVVNNNSTDRTQEILDKLDVRNRFQSAPGCGPARQMGQESARGKYILLADADCIYPKFWLEIMIERLQRPAVACVYGRYSFIGEKGYPRWKLTVYELFKDIIAELRHINRPYLNAFGMSMGYVREFGLDIGFVNHNIRGEDGRMCFDLMKYGQIIQVKSFKARVWTEPRTLRLEGGFFNVLNKRVIMEVGRISSFFSVHPPHDTKLSKNE